MTALGHWAMGLCAAGVVCAVLDMLSPGGGLKRVSTVLTAVFFFCCLIGPLGDVMSECRSWFSASAQATASVDTSLDEAAIHQVEALLSATLEEDAARRMKDYGVSVKKVVVERDTAQPESIYIKQVRVVFAKEDAPVSAAAIRELERAFGMSVEVYYSDE